MIEAVLFNRDLQVVETMRLDSATPHCLLPTMRKARTTTTPEGLFPIEVNVRRFTRRIELPPSDADHVRHFLTGEGPKVRRHAYVEDTW